MRIKNVLAAGLFAVAVPALAALPAAAQPAPPSAGPAEAAPKPAPATGPVLVVQPSEATLTTSGDASFTVNGAGFPAKMAVRLTSPGLKAACKSINIDGIRLSSDLGGRFNLPALARDCVPGKYDISATETATPYRTVTGSLALRNP